MTTLLGLGLALLSTPAPALRLARDPAQRCGAAELVVVAEVSGLETRWRSGPLGGLETLADLSVLQVLHGTASPDVRVAWLGGRLGSLVLSVEDQPDLQQDHRYALLLAPGPDDVWAVVDGPDGVRPLAHGAPLPSLAELCDAP